MIMGILHKIFTNYIQTYQEDVKMKIWTNKLRRTRKGRGGEEEECKGRGRLKGNTRDRENKERDLSALLDRRTNIHKHL